MNVVTSDTTLARGAVLAMGTRFEVVVDSERGRAQSACDAACECVRRLHALWTPYESSSAIAAINRDAITKAVRVDEETWRLLALCKDAWKATGGAFDATASAGKAGVSCAIELNERSRTVRFHAPMRMDVAAVAKGLALDIAGEELREAGVHRAFMHMGTSSVLAIGEGWSVSVAHEGPTIALQDQALGVSRLLPSDRRSAGHIVDPRSGLVQTRGTFAACAAGTHAGWCDAWSTAMMVGDIPLNASAIQHAWRLREGGWQKVQGEEA
jgi:thiamine biosynthesis lipoprotein